MAFNVTELAEININVGGLVRRRQAPANLRDQLWLELEVDGHRVRIWSCRSGYRDPSTIIRMGTAQFTYTRTRDEWKLYWMRADGKWHAWDPAENVGTLAELVKTVDEDTRGGFWD